MWLHSQNIGGMPVKPRILISRSPESSGLYEAAVEKAGGQYAVFEDKIKKGTCVMMFGKINYDEYAKEDIFYPFQKYSRQYQPFS